MAPIASTEPFPSFDQPPQPPNLRLHPTLPGRGLDAVRSLLSGNRGDSSAGGTDSTASTDGRSAFRDFMTTFGAWGGWRWLQCCGMIAVPAAACLHLLFALFRLLREWQCSFSNAASVPSWFLTFHVPAINQRAPVSLASLLTLQAPCPSQLSTCTAC